MSVDAKKLVLVAEDHEDIRRLLEIVFTQAGYQVKTVADGRAALKEIETERPDLVITDILMPYLNGFKLCESIKTDPRFSSIPVIMMTAVYRQDHHVDMGFNCGADAYFSKPFQTDKVLEVAIKLMGDEK